MTKRPRTLSFCLASLFFSALPAFADPEGMVWIASGEFTMGSDADDVWQNEKPAHRVRVSGFWIDKAEVTNAQFRKFVEATGYKTTAETAPTVEEILKQLPPGTPPPPPEMLVNGSLVFTPPGDVVPLDAVAEWWTWTPDADWRHPFGPDSNLDGKDQYPVVHVTWADAAEYAKWANKRLPTEAEWEYAAKGGREGTRFHWGDEKPNDEVTFANIWQGHFPNKNLATDGFTGVAPVMQYKPNDYGLFDTAGNVWEWTADWFRPDIHAFYASTGGVMENPKGPDKSLDPDEPYAPKRVLKGGSYLCHVTYCESYRPSARRGQTMDTSMSHVGFRCVKDGAGPGQNSPSPDQN